MPRDTQKSTMTRREMLERVGATAAVSVVATPFLGSLGELAVSAQELPLNAIAGVDRVVMKQGKTYLSAWAGYGQQRGARGGGGGRGAADVAAPPPGPAPTLAWRKVSGPGAVTFADPAAAVTTATFSATGEYVLEARAKTDKESAGSTLVVKVELPPPMAQLTPVFTTNYRVTNPLWSSRIKALIVNWIPHCVSQINRSDLTQGPGGIDNFIEAGKALRGEPHGVHKGYVFSNAWVHQTVEAMCLALMIDPQGDAEIIASQTAMKTTLEDWIPKILGAQHPDGYLQTAFTCRDALPDGQFYSAASRVKWTDRWSPATRSNHEGYVSGYFIESAINHYMMTGRKDARMYNAAKKLADCWADHIGPAPKQEWFDGHQEMEQALVRFGRFVNEVEANHKGDRYIALAKFLLDCRKGGSTYDQSHLPVQQQYEAVGHAVRAMYTYSGMADVAVETHDVDYQSAVKSLWDNLVYKKYYVTGGVGSGESSEGFGPNFSLRNNSYCENCSSCGHVFFQWKMHLAYHDAKFADIYEATIYNALFGGLDLEGKNFYYDNPLDANRARYPWHGCPCCVGNMPRTLLMLPTWMYSKGADGIYVNLFAGSTVNVEDVAGTHVEMVQTTDYPRTGKVSIAVNPAASKTFAVKIRVPNRDVSPLYSSTPAANGIATISVNGATITPAVVNGYAEISRAWKKGDRIDFELPMVPQRLHASDKIAANVGRVALRYGPMVYNIEQVDQDITQTPDPKGPLSTEWRADLLGGVTVIKSTFSGGAPLMAIPNYARYNRNPPPPPRPATPPAPTPTPAAAAGTPAPRPAPVPPPPPTSIVWMKE